MTLRRVPFDRRGAGRYTRGRVCSPIVVDGPYISRPLITTDAGGHFNSGFCLGRLLGLDNELGLLTGVTTSGFYVRTAKSPSIPERADRLRHWPTTN